MRKLKNFVAPLLLVVLISTTNPEKLPSFMLVLPLLLMIISLFTLSNFIASKFYSSQNKSSAKVVSIIFTFTVTVSLVLLSLKQLTLIDAMLFIILGVTLSSYLVRLTRGTK